MKFCPECSEFFPGEAGYCPNDGAELKRTHDPYLGRTIAARYRLVKRLGTGGMSSVYLAHHVMIERLSAIKILRDDLSLNPTHRERFLREARAVNRINHPNIVEISDLGEADGAAYLVMEYVDGPSLHQELNGGPLPWARAVRIAVQVAAALARAHQMGVIHRDLKPENILLAPPKPLGGAPIPVALHADEDLVKLTDFGIAKIIDAPALTFSEQLFGTPGYIAPEYIEGATADPRSDLYSLGVILYEMTTGALPYDGKGAALLTMPLRQPPIPPSRRMPGYPPDLEALVLKLLERRPDARPLDAFVVYEELLHLLAGTVVRDFNPESTVMTPSDPIPPIMSATPDATRLAYPSQPEVREDAHTMIEEVRGPSIQYARQTSDLALAEAGGTARWHEAVAELDSKVAAMRRAIGSRVWSDGEPGGGGMPHARLDRVAELADSIRLKIGSIERISRTIRAQQQKLDALEEGARGFRADVGYAIDQLVRDRSRERAHIEALKRTLESMAEGGGPESRHSDARLWESVALTSERDKSTLAEQDLTFQIDALQKRLDERNAEVDGEFILASGALEGSLSALRHVSHEIMRALTDASAELTRASDLPPRRIA